MKLQTKPSPALALPGPTIAQFEALQVDPERFDHSAHIFVAWSYLRERDLMTSIDRYRSTLKRLTRKLGVPDKYNETITWFFMILVAERMEKKPSAAWEEFVLQNSDLFAAKPGVLERFYTRSRLNSATARQQFLLPDRVSH